MTTKLKTCDEVETLRRGKRYREAAVLEKLALLLEVQTFDELLSLGYVLDVSAFADKTGYSMAHIRDLCRREKLDHIERPAPGDTTGKEVYFYFLREQASNVFKAVKARA